MKPDIPKFETRKELFDWLRTNKEDLIYQKKAEFKQADSFSAPTILARPLPTSAEKSEQAPTEVTEVKVRSIINTTYIRDSHKDVHIDGLWNKTLKENRNIKHIQEHRMTFDSIIADKGDLKAFTKRYKWRELGYDVDGETEALVFDSLVKQSRNAMMFKEYRDKNVDNHSVGMYYVKIKFAMDSDEEEDKELKAEYDKHIDLIANKEEVEKDGYFWAVYEAKAIEGSAVPLGSNPITPTLEQTKNLDVQFEDVLTLEEQAKVKAIKKFLGL